MSIPTPACTPGAEAEPGSNGPVPSEIATGACPPRPCSRSAVAPSPPSARTSMRKMPLPSCRR